MRAGKVSNAGQDPVFTHNLHVVIDAGYHSVRSGPVVTNSGLTNNRSQSWCCEKETGDTTAQVVQLTPTPSGLRKRRCLRMLRLWSGYQKNWLTAHLHQDHLQSQRRESVRSDSYFVAFLNGSINYWPQHYPKGSWYWWEVWYSGCRHFLFNSPDTLAGKPAHEPHNRHH